MTEAEIIYSLMEIIRNNEVNDDERLTESFLRNLLHAYRAESIKKEEVFSEEVMQTLPLSFHPLQNGFYESDIVAAIIYDVHRYGIQIYDTNGMEVPLTSKEEAYNSFKGRFFKPNYIAYLDNRRVVIKANLEKLLNLGNIENTLLNLLNETKPFININCVLVNPDKSPLYDWRTSVFPFPANKISSIKQSILRKEFGIMFEVKKDEIQNSRADNIIYQDESKLYK